jgi:hypothetical protein
MARLISDQEIAGLLSEAKPLPANWRTRLKMRSKANQAFKQRDLEVKGVKGHTFRLLLRQNALNPLDFSVILVYVDSDKVEYRPIRFQGPHPSQHTNKWEKWKKMADYAFRNRFHIHQATERYQVAGLEIDGYAVPTDKFDSFDSAVEGLIRNNGLAPREEESERGTLWDLGEGGDT